MKKLVFVLSVAMIAVIIVLVVFILKSKNNVPLPVRRITLTDTTLGDADEMVLNFKNDKHCKDKKTAFWLDAAWVNNVYSIIAKERGDGIRLYFAKVGGKKNTIVIVSTYRIGPDNNLKCDSKSDHQDYFDHNESFFDSSDRVLTRDSPNDPDAMLFGENSPCKSGDCSTNSTNHISCRNAYKAVKNCTENVEINTNSEWFSLGLLKAIKDDLADQTKKHPDQPGDGIRIYFALHTTGITGSPSTNPNHPGRHAFIIVTTYKDIIEGKDHHKDYFTCSSSESFLAKEYLDGSDNGEQCLNNCTGATLPSN